MPLEESTIMLGSEFTWSFSKDLHMPRKKADKRNAYQLIVGFNKCYWLIILLFYEICTIYEPASKSLWLKGDSQNVVYIEWEVRSAFSIRSDKIMKYTIYTISLFSLFQYLASSQEQYEFFKGL